MPDKKWLVLCENQVRCTCIRHLQVTWARGEKMASDAKWRAGIAAMLWGLLGAWMMWWRGGGDVVLRCLWLWLCYFFECGRIIVARLGLEAWLRHVPVVLRANIGLVLIDSKEWWSQVTVRLSQSLVFIRILRAAPWHSSATSMDLAFIFCSSR